MQASFCAVVSAGVSRRVGSSSSIGELLSGSRIAKSHIGLERKRPYPTGGIYLITSWRRATLTPRLAGAIGVS